MFALHLKIGLGNFFFVRQSALAVLVFSSFALAASTGFVHPVFFTSHIPTEVDNSPAKALDHVVGDSLTSWSFTTSSSRLASFYLPVPNNGRAKSVSMQAKGHGATEFQAVKPDGSTASIVFTTLSENWDVAGSLPLGLQEGNVTILATNLGSGMFHFISDLSVLVEYDYCGDFACTAGESCSSCQLDCGTCAPQCGNAACEAGETPLSCVADCPGFCGDSFCSANESRPSCPLDCNRPPSKPVFSFPAANSVQDKSINFSWTASADADNDTVYYYLNYSSTSVLVNCCNYVFNSSLVPEGSAVFRLAASDGLAFSLDELSLSIEHFIQTTSPPLTESVYANPIKWVQNVSGQRNGSCAVEIVSGSFNHSLSPNASLPSWQCNLSKQNYSLAFYTPPPTLSERLYQDAEKPSTPSRQFLLKTMSAANPSGITYPSFLPSFTCPPGFSCSALSVKDLAANAITDFTASLEGDVVVEKLGSEEVELFNSGEIPLEILVSVPAPPNAGVYLNNEKVASTQNNGMLEWRARLSQKQFVLYRVRKAEPTTQPFTSPFIPLASPPLISPLPSPTLVPTPPRQASVEAVVSSSTFPPSVAPEPLSVKPEFRVPENTMNGKLLVGVFVEGEPYAGFLTVFSPSNVSTLWQVKNGVVELALEEEGVWTLSAENQTTSITVTSSPKNTVKPVLPATALATAKTDYSIALVVLAVLIAAAAFLFLNKTPMRKTIEKNTLKIKLNFTKSLECASISAIVSEDALSVKPKPRAKVKETLSGFIVEWKKKKLAGNETFEVKCGSTPSNTSARLAGECAGKKISFDC